MKKFILKTLIFILIIISFKTILITSVLSNLPEIGYGFFLGENNKKNKIVIVGSSNVRHNFDYDLLNKNFKDYSVVGVALNAPSGLYPLIYKLKKLNIKKNDIVVFAIPYNLYNEDKFLPITSSKKYISLDLVKSAFIDYKNLTITNVLNINLRNIKNALSNRSILDAISRGENFRLKTKFKNPNEFHGNPYPKKMDSLYLNCYSNDENKFYLNDNLGNTNKSDILSIRDRLNKIINAKVLYRFPVLMRNQFELNDSKKLFLQKNLNFINSVESAIFERNYFYDQWYHLNFCGAQQNSLNFIDEITPFIENKNLTKS